MNRVTHIGVVVALAMMLIVLGAPNALAETAMSVAAPSQAVIGATVPVVATVTEDGEPIAGVTVVLSRKASFAGRSGYVEVVTGFTGDDGSVDLSYVQRAAEPTVEFRVEAVGVDVETLDFAVTSVGMAPQVYQSEVGVDLPGAGGWMLIALVGGLWLIILFAVLRLRNVAQEGSKEQQSEPGDDGRRRRLVPYVAASLVGLIAVALMIVLVRNPATHGNISGPDPEGRVTHSHIGEDFVMVSPGLDPAAAIPTGDAAVDGARLFFGNGCASCHGLDGVSGVVGGDISGPVDEGLDEFLDEVRRGPKGMPAYPDDAFSDEEMATIHAYLSEALQDE